MEHAAHSALIFVLLLASPGALAAPKLPEPGQIRDEEKATSPPPESLSLIQPGGSFRCDRDFIYEGRLVHCDSALQRDGDNLRPFLQGIPAAVARLDRYQENRRWVSRLAVTGTIGMAIFFSSFIAANRFTNLDDPDTPEKEGDGRLSRTGIAIRNVGAIGGLVIFAGSAVGGMVFLRLNEKNLLAAIDLHNRANPEKKIEIQWKYDFLF